MPQTRTACPRCRTPILAEVEQLIDVSADPQAKQRLLSGQLNVANCPSCGYTGMLSMPIVYHDPDKELLLTYFPSELGLPVNEQEKLIGPLITRVVNGLPPEKRKAYLLRPQAMLTFQTLIDRVLEADGITREMIEGQQQRLNLLRRLLSTPQAETRAQIIQQEEALIDQEFFALLTSLIQAQIAGGEENTARALAALQQELVSQTKVGQQLQAQASEVQAAVRSLQEASQSGLTREKLLDLLIAAPTEIRLSTLVGYARNGLDYEFFQILTNRIESASEADKPRLIELRSKLVEMTRQIDEQMRQRIEAAARLVQQIADSSDVEASMRQHAEEIDDFFVEALKQELQAARQKGDLERSAKLQTVASVLEKLSAPPPEVALIQNLISANSEAEQHQLLQENSSMVTPQFLQAFNQLTQQMEAEGQAPEVVAQLKEAYRVAMRFSMEQRFKSN